MSDLKHYRRHGLLRTLAVLFPPQRCGVMKKGYGLINDLASRVGSEFTHASLRGTDCPKKFGRFARARKRLAAGTLDDVTSVHLSVVPQQLEPFDADPKTDFDLSIMLDNELGLFVLSMSDRLAPSLGNFVHEFAPFDSVFSTQYGYAFESTRIEGPLYYALGVNFGEAKVPTDEDVHTSHVIWHWNAIALDRPARPERNTALRSIYPVQLLTVAHLNLRVGRTKLEAWIKQDKRRGTLTVLAPGVLTWTVSRSSIKSVREALYDAGLLWAWWPFGADEPDEDRPLCP